MFDTFEIGEYSSTGEHMTEAHDAWVRLPVFPFLFYLGVIQHNNSFKI